MRAPLSIKRNDMTKCIEYRFTFNHNSAQSLLMTSHDVKCLLNVSFDTKKVLDVFIVSMDGRDIPGGPQALRPTDFELIHDKPSNLAYVNVKGLEKEINYTLQLNAI